MDDDSSECVVSSILSACLDEICTSLEVVKEDNIDSKYKESFVTPSQLGIITDEWPQISHFVSPRHLTNAPFSWENYLLINGSCPCDQVSNFPHITESFHAYPQLKVGQYVGYCSQNINDVVDLEEEAFWPCRLISVYGDWAQLLPLRAKNAEDSMFWNLISLHCAPIDSLINKNFKCSTSFDVINNDNFIHGDEVFHVLPMEDCATAADFTPFDSDSSVNHAFSPKRAYELIKIGQYIEIQESEIGDPRRFWICKILDNVCGRLLLEYVALEEDSILNVIAPRGSDTFWEFYLNERIYPIGSVMKYPDFGWSYAPPHGFRATRNIDDILIEVSENSIEEGLFQAKRPLKKHNLEVDMKLEALHPLTRTQFYPANVSEILNEYYFVVELDLMNSVADESGSSRRGSILQPDVPQSPLQTCLPRQTSLKLICHKESTGIFPVGWCAQKRLRLSVSDEFDWSSYLKRKGGRMLNEHHLLSDNPLIWRAEFHRGQKFECVYPSSQKDKICVATVIRFIKPLLWVYFDSWPRFAAPIILHCLSTDLFPCGWCNSSQYLLDTGPSPSQIWENNEKMVDFVNAKYVSYEKKFADTPNYAFMPRYYMPKYGCQWSPSIFINTKCYVGPYLSRSRLSEMPRRIGPGPLTLVLKKVLRFVISSAYKPRDLFAEFQPDLFHYNNPFRDMVEIKAKWKGKRWRGMAEICKKTDQVDEWCHQLCEILDACPSLVSVKCVPDVDSCTYQCSKAVKNRYAGVVKCLSLLAAKKLDRRLKSRRRQCHQRSSTAASNARKLVAKANFNATAVSVTGNRASSSDFTRRTRFFRRHSSISDQNSATNGIGISKLDATQKRLTRNLTRAKLQLHSSKALTTTKSSALDEKTTQNGVATVNEPSSAHAKVDSIPSVVELSPFVVDSRFSYQTSPLPAPSPCSSTANVNFHIPPVLSNPMEWSHESLFSWLSNSDLSTNVALRLKDELVDGQAFMLLTLPDVQRFLGLKLGPALKLCEIIKQLKRIYLNEFAN